MLRAGYTYEDGLNDDETRTTALRGPSAGFTIELPMGNGSTFGLDYSYRHTDPFQGSHAIGARILRSHAELVDLKPNFIILDVDDQMRLVKQVMEVHRIDEKKWPPRSILSVIQRWKDRGLTPDKVSDAEGQGLADGLISVIYSEYQERLKTLNTVDFGDLLLHCLTIFSNYPDTLEIYQKKFKYILVDEYQDTNVSQYLWLRLLASLNNNICCVGDDDQSIYSWRGAEVGNILKFEKDFKGSEVIRLEQNYRSTPHILAAASGLIAKNQGRLGKSLWTGIEAGEKVSVRGVWDGEEEALITCDEIEIRKQRGQSLEEIAVLVRAGFQTREFEDRLINLAIPYRVIGGPRFYERMETRDAIAYFRILLSDQDDLAFERIINVPKRGLGKASVQALHEVARKQSIPLFSAAREIVDTDELKPRARNALSTLINDFDRWRANLDSLNHAEVATIVLEESGYTEMWQNDSSPDAAGRLENLKELISKATSFVIKNDLNAVIANRLEDLHAKEKNRAHLILNNGEHFALSTNKEISNNLGTRSSFTDVSLSLIHI